LFTAVAFFVIGTGLLLAGAEWLVRGAARLAAALGVSGMVIGLTVVAYGTSSPELVVSAIAAARQQPGLAIGNIVGSNILNVLVILGVTASLTGVETRAAFIKRELPIVLAVSLLFWGQCANGLLSRIDGVILLALMVVYTVLAVSWARRESAEISAEFDAHLQQKRRETHAGPPDAVAEAPDSKVGRNLLLAAVGLLLLVGGSHLMVDGAVDIALALGVSEVVIGLTIVALGTSLPELATSVVAVIRKEHDISLGNIVGSNIYNLLAIGGLTAVIRPPAIDGNLLRFHLPVMVGAAVVLWLMVVSGRRLSRLKGVVLLAVYGVYLGVLLGYPELRTGGPPA
jgi:cation:H+ antiporter